MLTLYGYYRSSASYRVRIALALKNLPFTLVAMNLLKGEQKSEAYRAINPQGLVPTLVDDAGHALTQSLAIIEYLEETHPTPALLPTTAHERARVRALALAIACEIAPLNNLGTLTYLTGTLGISEEARNVWVAHWLAQGFAALEAMLRNGSHTGTFSHGNHPGLAECFLIPQVYNARRYGCNLAPYPTITRIAGACEVLPAFHAAHPDNQPDRV